MILIRTAEDMARAIDFTLDPFPKASLQGHAKRLAEYDEHLLEELALFVIIQPCDSLESIEQKTGFRFMIDGQLRFQPECIEREGAWVEIVTILSDDGFGMVILAQPESVTDPQLKALLTLLCSEGENAAPHEGQ